MEEPQSDTQVLINHYKKLMTYKNNLFKLDTLISLEKDQNTLDELVQMRTDLLQAISYQEDVIKFTQNTDDYYFSIDRLTSNQEHRVAKAYHEKSAKWVNGEVISIDVENQEAEVYFIQLKEKLLPVPSSSLFQVGTHCEAIYNDDGKFFPCVIEKIEGDMYHVKYKKYNNKYLYKAREVKSINYMRESKNTDFNKQIQFDNLESFQVPEYLKIQPNDTDEQRTKKKKKVKALKQAFRNAQYEKDNNDKQSSWNVFKSKNNTQSKGYFKSLTKESIFKSPDAIDGKVGVVGSGKGTTHQKVDPNNAGYLSKKYEGSKSHLYKIY